MAEPLKYRPEFCDTVLEEYLAECKTQEKWPSEKGYAIKMGVSIPTLDRWRNKYPKFKEAMAMLKLKSEEDLVNRGLRSEFNPVMAKFILSSRLDYKERTDVTSNDQKVGVVYLPQRDGLETTPKTKKGTK